MSPTGRRRFRKMNRRFRQRGPAGVRERARKTTGGMARKMILVQYWGRDPLPLPPNPFTARSLVGMSQSSRKRAARAQFVELVLTSQGMEIKPDDQGPRWFHLWCRGLGDVASRDPDYAALRARYRIGERLRPCPGCCACGVNDPGNEYQIPWCDGSGVLPARRACGPKHLAKLAEVLGLDVLDLLPRESDNAPR